MLFFVRSSGKIGFSSICLPSRACNHSCNVECLVLILIQRSFVQCTTMFAWYNV